MEPILVTAFIGALAKPSVLNSLRDGIVDFLLENGKDIAGDELKKRIESLRSDAKINRQIQEALERAAKRWMEDSPDIEFINTVAKDTTFADLESVKSAIRTAALAPFNPIAVETLRGKFKDVLPTRFDEERIEQNVLDFLNILREEFSSIPALQPTLQTFANLQTANYAASLPHIEGLLLQLAEGPTATEETLRVYLNWVLDQHRYLDPKGAMQTVRQVQVLLEEVYVSLQAEEELPLGGVDRKLYEDELKAIQERENLAHEERDDLIENMQAKYLQEEKGENRGKPVELAELACNHEKLVLLGDPGAGKTTLLRYLALRHAQAQKAGLTQNDELGKVYLPLYLRIAEYAENADGQSLTNFLPENICGKNHCDKALVSLLKEQLEEGKCLILLDGLDEVIEPSQRALIASQINSLIRAYEPKGNRVVVTSRVAGYRLSPLDGNVPHYRAQDMNDKQISNFLDQWCNAVERFQTPGLSRSAQQANAQKQIDGITASIKANRGVKRLATNPLLLRILALIHKEGSRLPQRRIELYKLAADTLIRDWELAKGIPEAALVNDEEATRLLSELAVWMHENKPAGLATEGEVKQRLAEVKADLAGKDPSDPEIMKAVSIFLEKIRNHTGLFVERAPKRFGFMHLTFEEYFAARWLVNKPRDAARRIRSKLHRPRWQEPILLAIAFYGMNFDDVSDLIEEAILGKDGKPSPYEDILHRDLVFAIRILGDQDVKPALQNRLVNEFCNLWIVEKKAFTPLHTQWEQLSRAIENSQAGQRLITLLLTALKDENPDMRASAASALSNVTLSTEAVSALLTALKDENPAVRASAANALNNVTHSTEVVSALLAILTDENENVRSSAVNALSNATLSTEGVSTLLATLKDENTNVHLSITNTLGSMTLSSDAVRSFLAALKGENADMRATAASVLYGAAQLPDVVSALLVALKDENANVRSNAVRALRSVAQPPDVVSALLAALKDENANVRGNAALTLRSSTQFPYVVSALLAALKDENADVSLKAAFALSEVIQFPNVVSALLAAVFTDKNISGSSLIVFILRDATFSTDDVVTLLDALKDKNENVHTSATSILRGATVSPGAVMTLLVALKDEDAYVRASAVSALRSVAQSPDIVSALLTALTDENANVRVNAAFTLRSSTQSPNVVSALLAALKDENKNVRGSAASALSSAAQSPNVVSALLTALKDENDEVRASAASALSNATQFPDVVSALIATLKDKNEGVCSNAAQALRSITQNIKFKASKDLPDLLASCFELSGLEKVRLIINNNTYLEYSALDCLFDALLAVAGYPQVN